MPRFQVPRGEALREALEELAHVVWRVITAVAFFALGWAIAELTK